MYHSDHWFPWLDATAMSEMKLMKLYDVKESRADLRHEIVDALEALSPCDVQLYKGLVQIFWEQVRALQSTSFETTFPYAFHAPNGAFFKNYL